MWTLLTDNTSASNNRQASIPLFSTTGGNNRPPNFTTSIHTAYYNTTEIGFAPVEIKLEVPTPTDSVLYVAPNLVKVPGLLEVSNIHHLKNDSYTRNLLTGVTYIVTSDSSKSITSEIRLLADDFEDIDDKLIYTFNEPLNATITSIESEGLLFDSNSFTLTENNTVLTLFTECCCKPQPGHSVVIKSGYLISEIVDKYNAYIFDCSVLDVDFVDFITWNNKSFQMTNVISENTLLYNRLNKIAVGIWR